MKKIFVLVLLAVGLPLSAQTPATPPQNPAHFSGLGVGFQQNQKISGWMNFCTDTSVNGTIYACAASDMSGGVTSVRAGIEKVVFHQGPVALTIKGDAGIATGSGGGVGGSYGIGGSGLIDVSKWTKIPNLFLVGSASFVKSNAMELSPTGTGVASIFGSQGVYRFGIGRTF